MDVTRDAAGSRCGFGVDMSPCGINLTRPVCSQTRGRDPASLLADGGRQHPRHRAGARQDGQEGAGQVQVSWRCPRFSSTGALADRVGLLHDERRTVTHESFYAWDVRKIRHVLLF